MRALAFAKINLTLRVVGAREDGYHELRTVFQSLALHDTLIVTPADGPLRLACDDPGCPPDRTNLVWQAAEQLWRAAHRRGRPRGVTITLAKQIPMRAGLGGGSSDAAAALRALNAFWRAGLSAEALHRIARSLGADVPYFLEGGTALGLDRGDLLFPLADAAPAWVVVALPDFGVSTGEAFGWWDRAARDRTSGSRPGPSAKAAAVLGVPASELVNDLQVPVAAHHPEIARLVRAMARRGAVHAALSGSGSAVFGLFETHGSAALAAGGLARRGARVLVTRTLGRTAFGRRSAPRS